MAGSTTNPEGESVGTYRSDHDISIIRDSTFSWVVCAGLFFMLFLSLGYIRIFGILFVAFQAEFSSSASVTASIMGVYAIVYSVTSVFACNVLLERFSARQIAIFGGVLVSGGVALDVFATSVDYLMFTNGVIVGIGTALIYGPSIVVLGMYFDKRRTLATAIAFSGVSVGGIVLPPFIRLILDEYGFQGAMLIYGGLLLNVVPAAMLLIPPKIMHLYLVIQKRRTNAYQLENKDCTEALYNKSSAEDVEDPSTFQKRTFSNISHSLCDLPVCIPDRVAEKRVSYDFSVSSHTDVDVDSKRYKSLPVNLDTLSQGNPNIIRNHSPSFKTPENTIDNTSANIGREGRRFRDIIANTMDISLLKIPLFCMFIGVHIFGYAGIVTFTSFVPPMARDHGIGNVDISLLITLHAGLDLCCRIATGIVADIGWFKRYRMLAAAYIILGTTYHFARFFNTFPLMVAYVVIFGLFSGCFYSLHPSIAIDFFGSERFPKVFGYVQFVHGVVITASYPIIGFLRDTTEDYASSCHFLGVSVYIAAILLIVKPLFSTKKTQVAI